MSISAPNSRAVSPPAIVKSAHGGSRPVSAQKAEKKRRRKEIAAAATAASVQSSRQRQHLQECIDALANPSGRSLSSNELRIIIRLACWLQVHDDYSESSAIEAASVWAGSSRHTVAPAYY